MDSKSSSKKVIWTIDPFVGDRQLQIGVARALRGYLGNEESRIEPVFVLDIAAPFLEAMPELIGRTENKAATEIEAILKEVQLKNVEPVTILSESFRGLQAEVDSLLAHAKARQADLIVLSTHGRNGVNRWIAGSFAESVMLSSQIPILMVNPRLKADVDFSQIVFPTDFSRESRDAFDQVIEYAKKKHANLVVFHHIPYLAGSDVEVLVKSNAVYKEMFNRVLKDRQIEAKAWATVARKKGVRAMAVVDHATQASTAEAIVRFTDSYPSMIAIAAKKGSVLGRILGTTTRQVLRGAGVPVWVLRSYDNEVEKPLYILKPEDIRVNLIDHESGTGTSP